MNCVDGAISLAVDTRDDELFLQRKLEKARDIESLGGEVVLRVVTFAFRAGDYRWEMLGLVNKCIFLCIILKYLKYSTLQFKIFFRKVKK